MMPSYYVTVSIKLCPEVGNHEYIILRSFNGRSMSGSEVKEGGLREQPPPTTPGRGKRKEPALSNWTVQYVVLFSGQPQVRPVLLCDIIFAKKKIRLLYKRVFPSVY